MLGNHELFEVSHTDRLRLAGYLQMEPGCDGKLQVMNRNRFEKGVTLGIANLSCTLQSKIPPDAQFMVQMKVNVMKHIYASKGCRMA